MNTLTLFTCYEIARDESHRLDWEIESATEAVDLQRFRIERDRRDRFIASLERVIKARLAPQRTRVVCVVLHGMRHATVMRAGGEPREYAITGESYHRLRAACDAQMRHGAPMMGGYIWAQGVGA